MHGFCNQCQRRAQRMVGYTGYCMRAEAGCRPEGQMPTKKERQHISAEGRAEARARAEARPPEDATSFPMTVYFSNQEELDDFVRAHPVDGALTCS